MIKFALFLLLAICTVNSALSQQWNPQVQAEITDYLNGVSGSEEPGFAMGIVLNGRAIMEYYRGKASLQHGVDIDSSSVFNIASAAKQFTALAILDLILEGKINVQDDVRSVIPDLLTEVPDTIWVAHLLTHTSGIRDVYDLMSLQFNPWWRREGLDNQDVLDLLLQQRELNFDPGAKYLYSNSNYILLAEMISRVSGENFHEYTRAMFRKLGMNTTHFQQNYMAVIPGHALPYADWGDGVWQQYPMITNLYGDGFLYTTLPDQLRYEIGVQQAADGLLAISQGAVEGSGVDRYGYGLELEPRLGQRAVHHAGGTGAYNAQILRFPEYELAVVVLSNSSRIWSGFIADRVAGMILPERPSDVPQFALPSSPGKFNDIQEWTGMYENSAGGLIRIFEDEGKLYWRQDNNNPRALKHIRGGRYQWESDANMVLQFEGSGNKKSFTVYNPGNAPRNYDRLPDFTATPEYLHEWAGVYHASELGVDWEFRTNTSRGALEAQFPGRTDWWPIEVLGKDRLLVSDYRLSASRDAQGRLMGMRVSFNRLERVRFEKKLSSKPE